MITTLIESRKENITEKIDTNNLDKILEHSKGINTRLKAKALRYDIKN
jgi:hypothetical protein